MNLLRCTEAGDFPDARCLPTETGTLAPGSRNNILSRLVIPNGEAVRNLLVLELRLSLVRRRYLDKKMRG